MIDAAIPTTTLMQQYVMIAEQVAKAKAHLEQLSAMQDTLTQALAARIPAGSESIAHTLTGGITLTVKNAETSRFVNIDGQADDYWMWVRTHSAWDLVGRTIKQEGVKTYLEVHGTLPPHLRTMKVTTPTVSLKGLKKPATSL